MITDYAMWFVNDLLTTVNDLGWIVFVMWFFGVIVARIAGKLVATYQMHKELDPLVERAYAITLATWLYHPRFKMFNITITDRIYSNQGKSWVHFS